MLGSAPALGGPIRQLSPEGVLSFYAYLNPVSSRSDGDVSAGVIRMRLDGTIVDTLRFPTAPRPPLWTFVDATNDLGYPLWTTFFTDEQRDLWVSRSGPERPLLFGDGE